MNNDVYLHLLLGIAVVVQVTVLVLALVALIRDKRERVAGLPRLVWVFIILLGQMVGPIVFLVLHTRERRVLAEQRAFRPEQGKDSSTVINSLYGR